MTVRETDFQGVGELGRNGKDWIQLTQNIKQAGCWEFGKITTSSLGTKRGSGTSSKHPVPSLRPHLGGVGCGGRGKGQRLPIPGSNPSGQGEDAAGV